MRQKYGTRIHTTRRLSLLLPLMVGGGLSIAAQAQTTNTWTGLGTDANWSTAGNWNADGIPTSAAATGLDFTGSAATSNNNLGTFLLNFLQFDVSANLTLSGNDLDFVSHGAATPVLTQNTGFDITVNNNLTLTNNLTVNLAGSGTVNLAGAISGPGSLTISGSNAAYTTLLSNANNSYSGGTIVAGGTLQLGTDNALPSGSNLTLTGTTAAATLDLNGHAVTVGNINFADATANSVNSLTIADTSSGTTGVLTLNGNITYNPGNDSNENMVTPAAYLNSNIVLSAGQHVIDNNSTGDFSNQNYDVILGGRVSVDGGLDIGSVNDTSTGLFAVLAHTNTYTGPTNLINGSLFLGATNALPAQSAVTVGVSGNLYLYIASDYTQTGLTPGSYNQTIGSLADNGTAGGGNVYLGSATLTVGGDNTSTTFSGSIQDNDGTSADTTLVGGSLTKVGTGTLTLSGANTFSGMASVNAGTLALSNNLALQNNSVNIAEGAVLDLTPVAAQSAVQLGDLNGSGTLKLGDGILYLNTTQADTYSGLISGNTQVHNDYNGSLDVIGGGSLTLTGGTVSTPSTINGQLVVGDWRTVNMGVQVAPSVLTIQSGVINCDSYVNAGYYAGSAGTLNVENSATLTTAKGLTIAYGAGSIGNVVVDNATLIANSVADGFSGSGSLTVQNGGTVTAQWLQLSNNTGSSSTLSVQSGGTITLTAGIGVGGYNGTTAMATVTGAGSLVTTPYLGIGGEQDPDTGSYTLAISNGGSVRATGQTYFSTSPSQLIINGGTLVTGSLSNALGTTPTIQLTDPAGGTALTVGSDNTSTTYSGAITDGSEGSGSLTKIGTGTLTLTGANTFSGLTTLTNGNSSKFGSFTNGDIMLGNAIALQNSTVNLAVNYNANADNGLTLNLNSLTTATLGGLSGSNALNLGSTQLSVGNNNTDTTYAGLLSGTGGLNKIGTGLLTLTGGTASSPSNVGQMIITGGSISIVNADVNLNNVATLSTGQPALNIQSAGLTISNQAVVSVPNSYVDVDSPVGTNMAGNLIVTGPNTQFNAGHRLLVGEFNTGTISVQNAASVSAPNLNISYQTGSNGTIDVQSGGTVAVTNTLSIGGYNGSIGQATVTGTGSLVTTGELWLGGDQDPDPNGSYALTISNGGSVSATGQTTFWTSPSQININGGTLVTGSLSNAPGTTPTIQLTDPAGGTALTVGSDNTSTTYSGTLSGTGSLTKVGTGTLTLSGANTYSGTTNVNAGALVNNGLLQSLVQINAGTTHAGTGNDAGGYQINSGGVLEPGPLSAPGTLQSGNATWNGGGKLLVELNDATGTAGANWGLNQITGQLTMNVGTAPASLFTLAVQSFTIADSPGNAVNFDPTHSYSWTFVTTTQGIIGYNAADFTLDASGFTNSLDGGTFSLTETGSGDTLSLVFTPSVAAGVPEGSPLLSAGLMLLTGGILLRRRQAISQTSNAV